MEVMANDINGINDGYNRWWGDFIVDPKSHGKDSLHVTCHKSGHDH